MAGKLSFSIALNLLTENFKKGTNTVKNSFRSMQAQILAFAAALGFAGVSLSNLLSDLIRVARETSKAVTSLKNVSGSTAQFASNLSFTTQMAKKYGVYVNDLTGNFAKFTAAASIAGMSMDDQRKLFESLSRASGAFALSADETNGVFLAITQMMGKGKIQAEELRGQLGERLPIAMQAMAKAAGTTVAGLDKIMKEGKLLSADVLPKLADALNEMLPNVDTDNIETSLNRLKNGFQEFTENTGIQGAYKGLIDGLTGLINYAKDSMVGLVTFIGALIGGTLLGKVVKFFNDQHGLLNGSISAYERAEIQKTAATNRRVNAAKLLEATQRDYDTVVNEQRMATEVQLQKAKGALKVAEANEKKAVLAAQIAAENAAAIKSMGFWQKTGAVIKASCVRLVGTLRALWSTVWPMALVTAIALVISKLTQMYTEAKRIKNIFNDYKKESANISTPVEISQMEAIKRIADDTTRSIKDRNDAWAELASKMSLARKENETELDFHKRINDEIAKRIKLLENTAKADFYARQKVEAEDKFKKAQRDLGIQGMDPMGTEYLMQQMSAYNKTGSKKALTNGLDRYSREIWNNGGKFVKDYQDRLVEMSGYWDIMEDATKEMTDATSELLANKPAKLADTTVPGDDEKKKTPLQKAEESYARKLLELEVRREVEGMTVSAYNNSLDELNRSALIEARSSEEIKILESDYIKKLQERVDNPVGLDAIKSGYDRLTDTLGRKNEELSSVGADMVSRFGKGNVDLLNRPVIDTSRLSEKGWKDVGDGIATVFSSSMGVEQDGQEVTVHVTPILPDGSVLSESELNDYVTNILSGTRDILEADSAKNGGLGIVLGVDSDTGAEGASAWGEELHLVQEKYYDIKRQVDELNKSSEKLASTYKTATRQDRDEKATGIRKDFTAKKGDLDKQREAGFLSEKQYEEKMRDLVSSTMALTASLLGADARTDEFYQSLLSQGDKLKEPGPKEPEYKVRDKTFDYKKSDLDIKKEELSIAQENLEKIKEAYNNGAKDLTDELNAAMTNVTNLEDALKIAEVKKDIKDFSKELNEGVYSGIKEIASSSDRLVSAFSSLSDVMNDEDATAWERIMAVWNAMINTVDAFMSIVKTIESLTEITRKLSAAKQEEAAIDTATTTTKVANAAIESTAEITAAGTSIVADTAASEVKKKTATDNIKASVAEGAADSGKSAAKLPFPWNIVAIGGAIAAAIAAFALIPKFANGGIIQGSTTGDRNLARVNGGEMILNGHQQATLFQIANGKGIKTLGGGGDVEFKIKYDQLVGVLKTGDRNYRRGR